MKPALLGILAVLAALSPAAFAERKIATASQPMSLLGTDLSAKPLADEPEMPAMIVSRPCFMSSGIFEEVVGLIAVPHHLARAPEDFPKESNLVVLLGVKASGSRGEAPVVSFDLSEVTEAGLRKYGLSFEQLVKLLVHCTTENLRDNEAQQEGGEFLLSWKLPAFAKAKEGQVPEKIEIRDS